MDKATAIRYFNGLARGLGPDTLGMPVDAATQLANLGIAAGGYLGHKAGLIDTPPELIDKAVGGSDWITEKLGNPDDGSPAYTAGRLTPAVAGLAAPAKQGVAKLLDMGLSAPRAGGPAAQLGGVKAALNRNELAKELEKLTGLRSLPALETAEAGVQVRNQMRALGNLGGEAEPSLMTPEVAALAKKLTAAEPKVHLKHLYHTTPADRLASIREQGLRVGAEPRHPGLSQQALYLAGTPEGAQYFSGAGDVMLRTRAKALPKGLEPDPFGGDGSFIFREGLPPEALEVLENRRWKPLK